jgi:class 3 adenylate cyclase
MTSPITRSSSSVQNARDQLSRYFEQAGEEMEEHGGSEAYGLLTIGTKWEVYKYSVAKGVMETISTGQDFTGDDAVRLLHHLKLTLVPVSPVQLPPLTVPTPPMRRSTHPTGPIVGRISFQVQIPHFQLVPMR